MRPGPYHDELHTCQREAEGRRNCRNEGWIRAVTESHCRHGGREREGEEREREREREGGCIYLTGQA